MRGSEVSWPRAESSSVVLRAWTGGEHLGDLYSAPNLLCFPDIEVVVGGGGLSRNKEAVY